MNKLFFEESREQSEIKSIIVSKYFYAWANVVKRTAKARGDNIAYIDLFAGPGRFKDGAKSTPILVLEKTIEDNDLSQMLVTIFNDLDSEHTQSLKKEIESLKGIEKLRHKPIIENHEVGEKIVKFFEKLTLVPTFFFVDPWGYKGLSLRLINSVLKDWGCDCIFFFNYNRVNMGLGNLNVKEHIDALFGEERADQLREKIEDLNPVDRELTIVEVICDALVEMGGTFTLPFTFRRADGKRTSHHLIFVSKHVRGYEIMKEIMAKESSYHTQGVPSFQYNPARRTEGLLFELSRPLDDLGDMLLEEFKGQTLSMIDIYNMHHIGRPFIKKNYKNVLSKLEGKGKILVKPSADKRRKNTFRDTAEVTFLE